MQSLEDHQPDHQPRAQRSLTRTCRSPLQQFRYPCLRHHLQISFECPYQLRLCAILVKLTNSYGAKIRSIQSICADFCTFVQTLSTQPKICRLAAFAWKAAPRRRGRQFARFTTVSVTCEGYCREWCTALCATTPCASS